MQKLPEGVTKVLCIDDGGKGILSKGRVYDVDRINRSMGESFIYLREAPTNGMFLWRFISLPDEIELREEKKKRLLSAVIKAKAKKGWYRKFEKGNSPWRIR